MIQWTMKAEWTDYWIVNTDLMISGIRSHHRAQGGAVGPWLSNFYSSATFYYIISYVVSLDYPFE